MLNKEMLMRSDTSFEATISTYMEKTQNSRSIRFGKDGSRTVYSPTYVSRTEITIVCKGKQYTYADKGYCPFFGISYCAPVHAKTTLECHDFKKIIPNSPGLVVSGNTITIADGRNTYKAYVWPK